jgi:hypothetical protein
MGAVVGVELGRAARMAVGGKWPYVRSGEKEGMRIACAGGPLKSWRGARTAWAAWAKERGGLASGPMYNVDFYLSQNFKLTKICNGQKMVSLTQKISNKIWL